MVDNTLLSTYLCVSIHISEHNPPVALNTRGFSYRPWRCRLTAVKPVGDPILPRIIIGRAKQISALLLNLANPVEAILVYDPRPVSFRTIIADSTTLR